MDELYQIIRVPLQACPKVYKVTLLRFNPKCFPTSKMKNKKKKTENGLKAHPLFLPQ